MADIVFIGANLARADAYGLALSEAGHEVEVFSDPTSARHRLGDKPADLAVIEVSSADGGPGLLVGQTRAAWPDCRIIALTSLRDADTSNLREMGLWKPDLSLPESVPPAQVVRHVAALLASAGEDPLPGRRLNYA